MIELVGKRVGLANALTREDVLFVRCALCYLFMHYVLTAVALLPPTIP
jgi:hypothetical protein